MSLADSFIKSGVVADVAPEVDLGVTLPPKEEADIPLTDPEVPEVVQEETVVTAEETGEEVDALREFANAVGYTGEIEGDDMEALIKIAVGSAAPYKEKAQILEQYPVLDDLAKHIQAGGDPAEFFSSPQETSLYQNVVLAEDDVENREALFRIFFADRFTDDDDPEEVEEFIQTKIEKAKEAGNFNQMSDKYLGQLKAREANANTQIREAREREHQEAVQAQTKFFKEIETAFDSPLNGVVVDKSLVTKAKEASLPKNGVIGIQEVYSKLTGVQNAIVNTFLIALSEGKQFTYNPTKGAGLGFRETPVSAILNKQAGSKKGGVDKPLTSKAEIEGLIANLKKK